MYLGSNLHAEKNLEKLIKPSSPVITSAFKQSIQPPNNLKNLNALLNMINIYFAFWKVSFSFNTFNLIHVSCNLGHQLRFSTDSHIRFSTDFEMRFSTDSQVRSAYVIKLRISCLEFSADFLKLISAETFL